MTSLRTRLASFVEHPRFQQATIAVILLNALALGLETSPTLMAHGSSVLGFLDRAALCYFTVEVALRILAHGPRFFRSGWGWFDLAIVGVSLLPNSGSLSVLRALRILRALRLFSTVPALRRVVGALAAALPGMGSIAVVLGVLFYVSAVLSTKLFGAAFPEWFGGLPASLFTLFQIMTLEGWADGIVRPVLQVHGWAWIFFLPFIVVTSFAVLNLFIGVIVSALQDTAGPSPETTALREEIRGLREELRATVDALERVSRREPPTSA